jgi:hypothetical protein
MLEQAWFWAESHHHDLIAKALFRLLIKSGEGPILLTEPQVRYIQEEKRARRQVRLAELGHSNLESLEKGRTDLLSIGIFACNRFDLLKPTCETLANFLAEYGSGFAHEVVLFHDGPNEQIEQWARANSLFNKVIFNPTNRGLSRNINRFWFEESHGKYILNIEEDTICEFKDDFIKNAISLLSTDANVGCVRLARWYPDDFKIWNKARKMNSRILSEKVFVTSSGYQYRLLEKTAYDNNAALHRYSALALTGRMRDDIPRRAQEGEYLKRYNHLWQGARGVEFKDSPFLHMGEGQSCPTWQLNS